MRSHLLASTLHVYLPLLALGVAAGFVQRLARRAADRRRRRLLDAAWILLLVLGAPLWIAVATAMGWV